MNPWKLSPEMQQARSEAFTKDAKEKKEWTIAQEKARLLEHDKERKHERDDRARFAKAERKRQANAEIALGLMRKEQKAILAERKVEVQPSKSESELVKKAIKDKNRQNQRMLEDVKKEKIRLAREDLVARKAAKEERAKKNREDQAELAKWAQLKRAVKQVAQAKRKRAEAAAQNTREQKKERDRFAARIVWPVHKPKPAPAVASAATSASFALFRARLVMAREELVEYERMRSSRFRKFRRMETWKLKKQQNIMMDPSVIQPGLFVFLFCIVSLFFFVVFNENKKKQTNKPPTAWRFL